MHARKYIFTACICCGIVAIFASWLTSDWKATLKRELRQWSEEGFHYNYGVSMHAGTVTLFRLPARAGMILESHQREELLPCLSELQKSADLSERAVITYCILVVRDGLRGKPNTVEYTVALGSKPKKASVFDYCDSARLVFAGGQKQDVGGAIPATEEEEETAVSPRRQNP